MAVMTMERPTSESDEQYRVSNDERLAHAEVMSVLHDQLDPPPGWRVEIVEGKFEVSPTPSGRHAVLLRRIKKAIESTLPEGYGAFENLTVEEPEHERYVPDLGVWPEALVDVDDWVFDAASCLLAVEVTSPEHERRDYRKAWGYARSGTPIYLLVDRKLRACMVFTEPEGDHYLTRHEVPFGKPVTLPLDPPVTLETSDF